MSIPDSTFFIFTTCTYIDVIPFVFVFVVYHDLISLSVASDLYGKLTYDDLDCQKKIICEFMDEPEMFGQLGIKNYQFGQFSSK